MSFHPTPEIIWGLLSRSLGLVYLISFASLTHQVLPSAGSRGYSPIADRLARIRRDFPTWRRFFYFPTLSWLSKSDLMLGSFAWLGIAASVLVIAGGPFTRWAFLACYLLYLSIDRVMVLMFPWDCMLFEAGFFAILLPPLHWLPDLAAASAPLPALAWVYRLLLFRVLLGFGKFKFLGATRDDNGYLKCFLVNQPLPSPAGWLMQKLPLPSLKLALLLMFIIEIPLAFTVFWPGPWSVGGALAIDAFMLVIWLCGTFGYFSLIMMVVSLSWLDTTTASAFSFASFFSLHGPAPLLRALIFVHMAGAALSFPGNSYMSMTWTTWSLWERVRPRLLVAPIVFFRALHPFRWLHSYGVFPPHPAPPVKMVGVMEASWDGKTWHAMKHHYSPTTESSPPKFCAPYHARLDQALIYEIFALSDTTVLRNMVGMWDPYAHTHLGGSSYMMKRALQGFMPELVFDLESIPRQHRGTAPVAARVRTYMLEPVSMNELRTTGRWWKRTLIGPHSPPQPDHGFGDHGLPPPEIWHFEDLVWLRRSAIGRLMKRVREGEDPHALVLEGDLTAANVDSFWNDFIPTAAAHDMRDWTGVRRVVEQIREKYGADRLYRFERIAGRYGALMLEKLEPLFIERGLRPAFGKTPPSLDTKTYYHLGLLTRQIMSRGKPAYDAVMATPALARDHLAEMTLQSGAFLLVLFRYEMFVSQAMRLRLMQRYMEHDGRRPQTEAQKKAARRAEEIGRRLFGAVEMVEMLRTQFTGAEDIFDVPENWPRWAFTPEGDLQQVA